MVHALMACGHNELSSAQQTNPVFKQPGAIGGALPVPGGRVLAKKKPNARVELYPATPPSVLPLLTSHGLNLSQGLQVALDAGSRAVAGAPDGVGGAWA